MTERKKEKKKFRINYKKAARALALLLVALTFLVSYIPAFLGSGTSFDRDLIRPYGKVGANAPKITASAAAVYSLDLDQFVYEKNADTKMPPYSITKILTCYLALENLDPEQVVTASANACKELEDGMELELEVGEKHKALDLVYAAMLMSANDGATALGEAVAGSETAFAKLMNETVKEWGCENTHFVNANGWDNKYHYTTAHDMAIITKHCLENEVLRDISLTKEYTMPATKQHDKLKMENAFLKVTENDKAMTGGKTGSWSDTQCTLTLGFAEDGMHSVMVLLGDTAKGRMKDPRKLIDAAHEFTPGFIVTDSDKGVCKAWVRHAKKPTISLDVSGLRYAYPSTQKARAVKVKTDIDILAAPVKKGDRVGRFYIYTDDELAGQGFLYAGEDAEKGWLPSYLFISDRMTLMVGIAIALVLLLGNILDKRKRPVRRSGKHSRS